MAVCMGLAVCAMAQENMVENWELQLQRGAEGSMTLGPALRIEKTNALGWVVLRSAEPVSVEPDVTYYFRGYYHADDAPVSSLLIFRVCPETDNLTYNSIDRSYGYSGHSLIRNAPAGEWLKRIVSYKSNEAREVYLYVAVYGNPATVWVDDLQFDSTQQLLQSEKPEPLEPYTDEQVTEALAQRTEATGEVRMQDGRTVFVLNGEQTRPVIYKTSGMNTAHYSSMGEHGVDLATVPVQLGNIPKRAGVWKGAGEYDFTLAEEALRAALRRNPDANLIVDVWFYPYAAWGEENPEECWADADGTRAYTDFFNVLGVTDDLSTLDKPEQKFWYPSYNSDKWRSDCADALTALVEHLKATPMFKAVAGFYISGGHDGQFIVVDRYDRCADSTAKFREWLADRYGTAEALSQAWGQEVAEIAAVQVPPSPPRKRGMETNPPYLTVSPEMDFRLFAEEEAWRLRDYLAGVAKQEAGKPVFTLAYGRAAGPFFGLEHLDMAGHMTYYPYRLPGMAAGYPIMDSYALHGKMFVQELDLRSWVGSVYREAYQGWIGAGMDIQHWREIHRKLVGRSLAGGHGWWYYDMNHYFQAPEIMAEIETVGAITRRLEEQPAGDFRPDVCVVRTVEPQAFLGSRFSAVKGAGHFENMQLEISGVPFDSHYLDDILALPELQSYKVYVFVDARFLTAEQREGIASLKSDGRTLVFVSDSGYISEGGKSVETMRELTGIGVATEEKYDRWTAQLVAGQPLTDGALTFQGMAELMFSMMRQEGSISFTARPQQFWVEDDEATVLATYAENGKTAMATRQMDGWTSVYLGPAGGLGAGMLNAIARQAGAYAVGAPGHEIYMNGKFVSLHALHAGEYTLNLPAGVTRAVDLGSGEALPVAGGRLTMTLECAKTYWLGLE